MTPMDSIQHLTEEEVEKYCLGEISEPALGSLEEHLLLCHSCQLRVDSSDTYIQAIRHAAAQLSREPAGNSPWTGGKMFVLLIAATVLLVATALPVFRRSPPVLSIGLAANRAETNAKAPEGAVLILRPDVAGLPTEASYRMEVVDHAGRPMWHGAFPGSQAGPFRAGLYFVRVFSPNGALLREYGLDIVRRK